MTEPQPINGGAQPVKRWIIAEFDDEGNVNIRTNGVGAPLVFAAAKMLEMLGGDMFVNDRVRAARASRSPIEIPGRPTRKGR
jgi:hypothetical protein